MLTNPEELKSVSVALEDGALDVCMRISCGFPLKLNLKLPEGSKELVSIDLSHVLTYYAVPTNIVNSY